ncbi:zinc finger, CCHC-type containing protein [Tanacetum coccineum]
MWQKQKSWAFEVDNGDMKKFNLWKVINDRIRRRSIKMEDENVNDWRAAQLNQMLLGSDAIFSHVNSPDSWSWTLNNSGGYTVASSRNMIDSRLLPKGDLKTRWIRYVPNKVNTFAGKLDKFKGVDFRRWQKKMHFFLSSMSVVYVLTTPMPEDGGDDATVEQIRKRAKWDNDDYVCRGLILNGMSDSLFDIYLNVESSKELWDSLKAKYMAEDASSKKFLIDFKHTLKHKKEELTLVEFGSHLRIEESLRMQDSDKPKGNNVTGPSVVNMVEYNNTSRYNDNKGKRKHHDNTKADPNKKSKVACWKCGKPRHLKKDCKSGKVGNKANDSGTNGSVDGSTNSLKGLIQGFSGLRTSLIQSLKLRKRGIECIFVGYAEHSKAFRFFVIEPNDSVAINSIIESRDAIFDENRFSSVPRPSLRIPNGTEDIGGSVVPKEVTEEDDPKTFDEAMKSQDVAFWNNRMLLSGKKQLMMRWTPSWATTLGCWLIYLQGFKQKSEIDYFDTYAPVARISTIRLLIAIASIHNLIIHQTDVKTAFLNGDLDEEVDLTNEFLSSKFSMKDMGEADVILGIRIKHESNGITISQTHYIENVLKKFNYFECTPVSTPMDTAKKLMPNNGQAVSQLEYSRVIGCLMYAMTCTRPDIAFAVGKLSSYTSNPEEYTDASWINNTEDNSSTSGWVFLLGSRAISWASKKQTFITGSTMESEFVALAVASKEAEWLKNLLLEIPLWSKPIAPISIHYDSVATLAKAYSQMYNEKSRHLGVRHIMIRELITNGVISIEFVRSQQNLADHLTKVLARDLVIKSAEGMRLKSN